MALSTDIIVGFPGETEADFEATLDVVEQVGFAAGLFVQVQPAAGHAGRDAMADRCPRRVKAERLQRLQQLIERQQTAFNSSCVGQGHARAVRARGAPRRAS